MAIVAGLLVFAACRRDAAGGGGETSDAKSTLALPPGDGITRYSYEVVAARPHDRAAFTQGLVYRHGALLEGTGLVGRSELREVDIESGQVRKRVSMPPPYFGEGIAVLGDRVFQLTWQHGRGFIYDADTFRALGEFAFTGEGWGLTTDGRSLILSDGSDRLRFLDPSTFEVQRTVSVTRDGQPLGRLNELEFIDGQVFANVWQTEEIVGIDPATGIVRTVVDLRGILPPHERRPDTDVLNGIAFDPASRRLFVTGKHWPKVYEIRLKRPQ